ncbi:chromate efflux transporter [Frigidibacter sp. MR17.24]|uniref:chromate efflux transporter n=1 Tax=Frigidibacter sp. MR17.24 TaxID=3127345 RepID=UPI003012D380
MHEIVRVFLKIGLISFGGPAAQIALMHRELVETRRWCTEADYLAALSLCMLLPGPEAMQLATWAGWRRGGVAGGLVAGALFVLPGAVLIAALAAAYLAWGGLPWVAGLFLGVKAAVVAVVIEALLRVARRALGSGLARAIAAAAFVALFVVGLPFPAVLLAAAACGALWLRPAPRGAAAPAGRPTGVAVAACALAWAAPLAALWLAGGGFLLDLGLFFSRLAVLSFGGAYALLAWMVTELAEGRGWVSTGQMIDALGLAETTPGPLILVTEFVGFLAGYGQGGWGLALAAAALVLWVTFLPSFLFVFAAAPHLDRIVGRPRLAGALAGVGAAVVGVIATLAAVFALHLLFGRLGDGPLALPRPDPARFDWRAGLIALGAGVALLRLRLGLPWVLGGAALAGLALTLAGVAPPPGG